MQQSKCYLANYPSLNKTEIISQRKQHETRIYAASSSKIHQDYNRILEACFEVSWQDGQVVFLDNEQLSFEEKSKLARNLLQLHPWRKGPFCIADIELDAEWRSDYKWHRIIDYIDKQEGLKIADIGANNGYFMYQLLQYKPEIVIGFEPSTRYYMQFNALQKLVKNNPLYMEPFGYQALPSYLNFFDQIFCMGIVYHHSDPVEILRLINRSLRSKGQIIVESQAISSKDDIALFPKKTYAKVSGTYFVPSASCLVNWLHKAKFVDIEVIDMCKMTSKEQRRTAWMLNQSYKDFVNEDESLTIEGYEAPSRVYITARKK